MWRVTFLLCTQVGVLCVAAMVLAGQPKEQQSGDVRVALHHRQAPAPDDIAPLPPGDVVEPLRADTASCFDSSYAPGVVPRFTLNGMQPDCPPCCCRPHSQADHCAPWRNHIKPWLQCTQWGYADLFDEMPLGACVLAHARTQICNGLAAQVVLYRYDFCQPPCSQQLNAHGLRRLQEIKTRMQACDFHPLLIEASGVASLDAARQQFVLKTLAEWNFAVPNAWVVVGDADHGLPGQEAVAIQKNMLNHLQTENPGIPNPWQGGSGAPSNSTTPAQPNTDLGPGSNNP